MNKGFKIFLILLLTIIVFYAIRFFTYEPELQCKLIFAGYIHEFNNLSVKNITKFESDSLTTGIDINIYGHINGEGLISIGYNDSTSIYDRELESGKVEFAYSSDWRSKVCYVSFTPTDNTTGNLEINCFFGSD
jgi:hypothetical protein